jgi:hypothetical protein
MGTSSVLSVLFLLPPSIALAFDLKDAVSIGAAYTTHLFIHEVGHQVLADEVGADSSQMSFFTFKNGRFYPGQISCQNIPKESKLSFAVSGERMAGFTLEYALQSYHRKPTTYNKALMFFSCTDFVVYTILAYYVHPDDETYDPNMIRAETGCSKELLLGMVLAKSLLNAYRVVHEDANFIPLVWVDKKSAGFMIRFNF